MFCDIEKEDILENIYEIICRRN